ncbi:MAG: transketolase [Bacilli bacterium]|jgi:transketolase|nr:transketolase [Bacilli bacterium]MCH4277359.1 transketolase [Bacilli bacterium]
MELFKKENSLDKEAVAAIRSLLIDEINKAKSGHPGMALDIAPALYVLYKNHLIADPKDPKWINRDRFVLSSGHNSALLYAMLHVAGYAVSMDDIKKFRQLNSITPGHPEVGMTPGVDATAGPLGQGVAQAVGMAMAEEAVRASYPEGGKIMSHRTYCLCGDGCLEEGLSQEAISFAGKQKLGKLILIYDANTSTLDGPTSNSMDEDVKMRFMSAHWNVYEVKDGNDLAEIDHAISKAKEKSDAPSMIMIHTIIGFGSALQGSHKTHGNPLGAEDGAHAKSVYGFDYPDFTIPDEVYKLFKDSFAARGEKAHEEWNAAFASYGKEHEKEAKVFKDAFERNLKDYRLPKPLFDPSTKEASRSTSGRIVANLPKIIPFTLGGSADVAGSVKTAIPGDPGFDKDHRNAKNVNFGIREFAMASIQNGMLLHGGLVTYVGCFLIFSDYMKNAIRMSCLEKVPAIYLFSHDSIAVGEDGETHQPIEQLAALRTIPGLRTIRPADAKETSEAWQLALDSVSEPTAIILSRQDLPLLAHSSSDGVDKGAYVVSSSEKKATIELIATGSEVSLAIDVQKLLALKGIEAEVVSMPCVELFEKQSEDYKKSVLSLPKSQRYSLEMACGATWYKYADHVISLDEFGRSAPEADVIAYFGWTKEEIAKRILATL